MQNADLSYLCKMLIWSKLLPFGLLLQFLIIYYYYRKAGKIHVMFCNWILIKRGKSSTISLGFSEKLHIFSKRKIHREKYIINNTFHSWHMYNSYWISKNYDSSGQCNGSTVHNGATFLVKSYLTFFAHFTRWFSLNVSLAQFWINLGIIHLLHNQIESIFDPPPLSACF